MSTADRPETRSATAEEAGRNCPYCRFALKQGAPVTSCPACHAIHHEECWGDNHGCAIVGCSTAPSQATSAASTGQPAPSPPAVPPPAFATAVTAPPPPAASPSPAPSPTPGPSPSPSPSPSEQKRAIAGVLRDYEAAYSGHDIAGLRAIMEPSVTRHGLRYGGCSDTSGRAAVLETYSEQFATSTGTYTLYGLNPGAVDLTDLRASVPLTYSIGGGGSGSVRFDLRQIPAVGWRISHIDASC
jgi:hypothetical protein